MAELRHGKPVILEGWMTKEGKLFKGKLRRYMKLRGGILSNHHQENAPATWEVSVSDIKFACGPRPNEIVVHFPDRRISFFVDSEASRKAWVDAVIAAGRSTVRDHYVIGAEIGRGAFAKVYAGSDKLTGERVAVKEINKKEFEPKEMEYILREVNIMKSISHPKIISTYDVFNGLDKIHLVLEYMEGGELFDQIANAGQFSEKAASMVFRQILEGITYLHSNGIAHRDLKPENVLCVSESSPLQVKLADFGLAYFVEDQTPGAHIVPTSMIGTPGYVAPEIVKKERTDCAVDMWSCGVILYIMLSGKMPFYGRDERETMERTASATYNFPDREWSRISANGKSLVKSLLQLDPAKRLTAKAGLEHAWMDISKVSDEAIGNDLSGIHSSTRKFRRVVNTVMTVEFILSLLEEDSDEEDDGEEA